MTKLQTSKCIAIHHPSAKESLEASFLITTIWEQQKNHLPISSQVNSEVCANNENDDLITPTMIDNSLNRIFSHVLESKIRWIRTTRPSIFCSDSSSKSSFASRVFDGKLELGSFINYCSTKKALGHLSLQTMIMAF